MTGLEQQLEDLFFEWRVETAHHHTIGSTTLFGPLESLLSDSGRNNARGEEGDRWAVEQSEVSCVIVINAIKTWVAVLTYPVLRPSLPITEISNTDSPRETRIAQSEPKPTVQYIRSRAARITFLSAILKVAKFEYERKCNETFVICLVQLTVAELRYKNRILNRKTASGR